MKHLFPFVLLALSPFLHAETFFDRFKVLEDRVQEISFEINNIKNGTPSSKSRDKQQEPSSSSKHADSNDDELQSMKSSLRALEYQQKALIKELLLLKRSAARPMIAAKTQKIVTAAAEEKDDGEGWGDEDEDGDDAKEELTQELEEIHKKLSDLRRKTNGSNMKINADFRTSVDTINYTMADGTSKTNDAFLSNRLWLDFKYKATENSSFTSQLAYNKAYGQRRGINPSAYSLNNLSGFDWVTNTVVSDDTVRVKKAYWFYQNSTFLGISIPWTFSLGRRPSTNGHLINLRDDDSQSSPLAHFVNVEFDGGSSKFDFSELTGINGLYAKLCFGRGLTNASEKFSGTPYANNSSDLDQIDMIGIIISLFDNGQYSLVTQTVRALNLIDVDVNATSGTMLGDFYTTGNMNNFTVQFEIEGIGNDWSEFLNQTTLFASYSLSQTEPKAGQTMFGSATSQIGSSYWVGLQMPGLSKKSHIGVEYNHGDKYWRSITYAEDTLIGSKIAVRGDAYEVYWTENFDEALSFQLRYTYIDYSHTGSNGFFGGSADGTGGTGTPFTIAQALANGLGGLVVDTAQDIRLYARYRF